MPVRERRKRSAAGMAVAAIAEDLQMMAYGMKTHRAAGIFLKLFELLRNEFDDFAALQTDHVFVMLMPVDVLEIRAMRTVKYFAQNTDFAEQHEASINCRLRCFRSDLAHFHEQPVGIEMFVRGQNSFENFAALRRVLQ